MSRVWQLADRLLLVWVPLWWLNYIFHADNGLDFYPLYLGAQLAMQGKSPYGPAATNVLIAQWDNPCCAVAGVAYPLPLLLLLAPLALLAFPIAALLWTAGGFAMANSFVLLARAQSTIRQHPRWYRTVAVLLPFTYCPFYQTISLSQATLIWFGLASILVLSIRRDKAWPVAACVILLMLKPQNGIIFALCGLCWLFCRHRRVLVYTLLLGSTLLAVSLAQQPMWIPAWIAQMAVYEATIQPTSLLPLGLIFLVVAWRLRMPWWARAAIFQVILFPFSSMYGFLPLLLAWSAFSPPLALLGTSLSWLWHFFPVETSVRSTWLLLLLPLILLAAWEGRPQELRRSRVRPASPAAAHGLPASQSLQNANQ